MPYNSQISVANAAGLIPVEYAGEILSKTVENSAVLRLARRLRDMPTNTNIEPVLSSLPTAYFVNGATGLKQTSQVTWANVNIVAEDVAVIVPIPQNALDDSAYPIWDLVKPLIEEAAGLCIDSAILYGTGIPASWQVAMEAYAGLLAYCVGKASTVSLAACTDIYDAIASHGGILEAIELDGYTGTGHIGALAMKAFLRGCRDANGQPIFRDGEPVGTAFATGDILGTPVLYPLNGSLVPASTLDFVGQWSELVYKMRQDISWKIATEATIQDQAGNIVYNLFQQDMVALRLVMRLGVALPNPINRINGVQGTRSAFAVLTP